MFEPLPAGFYSGWLCLKVMSHELDQFQKYVEWLNMNHGYTNINTIMKTIKNQGLPYVYFYWQSGRLKYCAPYSMGKGNRQPREFGLYYAPDMSDFLTLITA